MSAEGARLWDGDRMVGPYGPLNDEQAAATADRDKPLLLEASAGAGKTLVLVERFVRDVLEGDGGGEPLDCDEILTITFTRKAAAELRGRIRRRLSALAAAGGPHAERARAAVADLDGAWISTIDAFCARVLRRHALLAGVDPAFSVIDESDLNTYRRRAFAAAVERLLEGPDQEALLDLLAADRYEAISKEIADIYDGLRSAGSAEPRLPAAGPGEDPGGWVALLDSLLAEYGEAFAAEKRRRGGCDFSDVVFATLGLFQDHPAVAGEYRERFQRVLIDEFQDTNGLQLQLFEALAVPARFQVGDPLQSIYGFRHADVEIFRGVAEEHDGDGRRLQLVRNYRSRPEILEVINAGFCEAHAMSGFDWIDIASGHDDPARAPWSAATGESPFVELLFTDRPEWNDDELSAGQAEARLVANRVRRLVDEGEADTGEVVILLETRSAMATYRDELRRVGIEAVSDGGDSWWERGELQDLLVHVRLLANHRDEEQLLGALRSPLCAVGLDTLALIGAERLDRNAASLFEAAGNAAAESPVPGTPAASVGEAERERLRRYMERFEQWSLAAGSLGAGDLLDRMVRESGYESLLLQAPGGELALANVRKLTAMAHAWDAREGGDIRAFLDWVDGAMSGSRETDAPVGGAIDIDGQDDPLGPVRLMTIHAAKGLEFPVVVVPRLGNGVQGDTASIRVEGDRVGLSLHVAGDGSSKGVVGPHAELKEEADLRAHHERRRSIHVAVTRAERRLILSGAAKASGPWKADDTSTRSGALKWMVPALLGPEATEILEAGVDGDFPVGGVEGAPAVRLVISTPEKAGELMAAEAETPGLEPGEPLALLAPATGGPNPRGIRPTVSYSQLSRFAQCSYRWYLEQVVRLPPRADDGWGADSGAARARGTLTHRLLELFTFSEPEQIPDDEQVAAVAAGVEGAAVDRDALREQREMLERFAGSGLWTRIAQASSVERESSFAIEMVPGDSTLPVLTGAIDLLAELPGGRTLVLDYKTDRLSGGSDDLGAKVEERYALQRDAYALVALRRGAREVEVSYCFLERPDEPVCAIFTPAHEEQLASRLAEAARLISGSEFPVSGNPGDGLCAGCPARPLKGVPGLCSYTFEETTKAA